MMTIFSYQSGLKKGGLLLALTASIGMYGSASGEAVPNKISVHQNQFELNFASDEVVTQQKESYICSARTKKTTDVQKALLDTLPADRKISVTYLSADVTSLAILPIDGKILVFSNVMAADGSKYVADRYFWWSKGNKALFGQVNDDKNTPLDCALIKAP